MWIEQLNSYFSKLQQSSKELSCLEGNLSVYLGMTHFKGLAPGAVQAAKQYLAYAPARIVELKIKLNNGRIPICLTYQKSIKLKVVKFPSNPGHMR